MVQTFVGCTKKVLAMVQVTRTMEPSWERFQRSLLLNYNLTIYWITITMVTTCNFSPCNYYLNVGVCLVNSKNELLFFLDMSCLWEKKTKKINISTTLWRNVHIGHIILILCLHSNFLLEMFFLSCFKALFSLC
jgi:hypothetical protein